MLGMGATRSGLQFGKRGASRCGIRRGLDRDITSSTASTPMALKFYWGRLRLKKRRCSGKEVNAEL